jgi:two-component system chemotaxis response regulator CheY
MKRVVIADDSATARMFVRRCLEISGLGDAEFHEASNGVEAMALLKEQKADLLVTDLTMPEMGGLDLMKRIAASPFLSGVPVIVITSSSNPAVEEELTALGAKAILGKPISPPRMIEALELAGMQEEQ